MNNEIYKEPGNTLTDEFKNAKTIKEGSNNDFRFKNKKYFKTISKV